MREKVSVVLLTIVILANMSFFAWLCTLSNENIKLIIFFIALSLISTIIIMKIHERFG